MNREKAMAYGSLPVVYMSSCSTTPIDITDNSLGSTMILHNPGPIAVIGAGDEVYLNYNITLNNRFIDLFYTSEGRMSGRRVPPRGQQHQVLGLTVYQQSVLQLSRRPGPSPLSARSHGQCQLHRRDSPYVRRRKISVAALSKTRFSGNVTRPDGSVDTSFSGKLYIDIYATPTYEARSSTTTRTCQKS